MRRPEPSPLVEVTVAAGWSLHDPSGDVLELATGVPLEFVDGQPMDIPISQHLPPAMHAAKPGDRVLVPADAVPRLLAMGTIEAPATATLDRLLSPRQAADFAHIAEKTLVRLVSAGQGPTSTVVDGRTFYREGHLRAWLQPLARNITTGTTEAPETTEG